MNKGLKGVPNRRLKEERELRGWSQKYVAEHIGADHYYLNRWERGTSVLSPFYRQKLCILFGKTAKELGLPGEDADESHNTRDKEAVLLPPEVTTVHNPAIPFLSVAATGLIGREDILSHLKECLCSGKNAALTALNGIPGVGKTTLAVTLAHDDEVLAHYSDGYSGLVSDPGLICWDFSAAGGRFSV